MTKTSFGLGGAFKHKEKKNLWMLYVSNLTLLGSGWSEVMPALIRSLPWMKTLEN